MVPRAQRSHCLHTAPITHLVGYLIPCSVESGVTSKNHCSYNAICSRPLLLASDKELGCHQETAQPEALGPLSEHCCVHWGLVCWSAEGAMGADGGCPASALTTAPGPSSDASCMLLSITGKALTS